MTRILHRRVITCALFLLLPITVLGSSFNREILQVVDVNPDPNVFEASLAATEQNVTINGQLVRAMFYKDLNNPGAYPAVPDGIPVPQIQIDVGDEVVVHFRNDLNSDCSAIACNSSIHWHGLELDNDSDGTGVTQNRVKPGESYTYRFIAPRPGLFWFHPHMLPGPQTFAGMYGAFIVRDPAEAGLQAAGVLPGELSTHTVVLSDIEFDNDPTPGQPAQVGYNLQGEIVPWAVLKNRCEDAVTKPDVEASKLACRTVQDGKVPLVNGSSTQEAADAVGILARRGEGVRLRLINTSTNRYFLLKLLDNDSDNNLYRVGGEGGLLEFVRLEGGVLGQWDTKFAKGELLLPPSGRADVVLIPDPPPEDEDQVVILYGDGFNREGPADVDSSFYKPAEDLIFIVVSDQPTPAYSIAEGDPLLGSGAIENLKAIADSELGSLLDPPDKPDNSGPKPGTTNDIISLDILESGVMGINGIRGKFEDSGEDYREVPHLSSTRYAKTGDVIEMTVRNCGGDPDCTTGQHHPFHLHGFSFQPVRIIENITGNTLYEFDYEEFQDVIDVPIGHSVVFRAHLEDRPIITDDRLSPGAPPPDLFFPGGGAQGRWVFHCHLFLHASIGMISELVVVPSPVAVCKDVTANTAPGFCSAGQIAIDDGSFHPNAEPFSLLQNPSSGVFQLGDTTASLTATGSNGISSSCEAVVTVIDNEDPTITAPADIVAECTETGGRRISDLGTAITDDNCGENFTQSFPPNFFPLGDTLVRWRTSDGNGNSAQDGQLVTIQDTKKPSLSVPADIGPVECTGSTGEVIDIGLATATDACDSSVAISNNAPAVFPLGTTVVQWTGRDDSFNTASGSQSVTVGDSGAPSIACNVPEKISPSQVVQSFTATAEDTCDTDVVPEAFEFDCYAFNKNGKRIDRTGRCDIAFRGNTVDVISTGGVDSIAEWSYLAVDDSGNSTTHTCSVEVVRKKDL